jgi:hypothetical protein
LHVWKEVGRESESQLETFARLKPSGPDHFATGLLRGLRRGIEEIRIIARVVETHFQSLRHGAVIPARNEHESDGVALAVAHPLLSHPEGEPEGLARRVLAV